MLKTTDALPSGLARYLKWSLHDIPPSAGRRLIRHEDVNFYCLARLDDFISTLLRTPNAPIRLDISRLFGELELETRRLSSFFRDIAVANEAYSPFLLYAPHLALFFREYRQHKVSQLFLTSECYSEGLREQREVFNDFYAIFRSELQGERKLRVQLHNWRLGSIENLQRLQRYLNNYFQANRDVTVMHFTLFHSAEPLDFSIATTSEQKQFLNQLSSCRETFFNAFTRKRAHFPHKPGFIWAVEPSLNGGYGLRITLLFNTKVLRKDHPYSHIHAQEIGAYWVSRVTKGLGHYRQLAGDRSPIMAPASERIEVDEPRKFNRMKRYLECMALHRSLVRVVNQPNGKYFGTPKDGLHNGG